jgi:CRISPR-associated protein Csm4|tara:strand:- start:5428 stop:6465 length:1038 start_codon:yes stop_codon:yes gene_type:complete
LKVFEITIKPVSGFGTPLKGDTIFGHFCWQIAYDKTLLGQSIENMLCEYSTRPFAIFSSAYPKFCVGTKYHYIFKTPNLPLEDMYQMPDKKREKIKKIKEYKANKWMIIQANERFSSFKKLKFVNDKELLEKAKSVLSNEAKKQIRKSGSKDFIASFFLSHNTINRLTGTTGGGDFTPFQVEQKDYFPESELALFVGIDDNYVTIEQLRLGLERIGEMGFGKDASTGYGRFELGEDAEVDLSTMGCDTPNACYTLAPSVPEKDAFVKAFFSPFTRYGKHGDALAKSRNPFKNPVIMADEGAILKPKKMDIFRKAYIGTAVSNLSKTEPKTVSQGYSLYIPVKVET